MTFFVRKKLSHCKSFDLGAYDWSLYDWGDFIWWLYFIYLFTSEKIWRHHKHINWQVLQIRWTSKNFWWKSIKSFDKNSRQNSRSSKKGKTLYTEPMSLSRWAPVWRFFQDSKITRFKNFVSSVQLRFKINCNWYSLNSCQLYQC